MILDAEGRDELNNRDDLVLIIEWLSEFFDEQTWNDLDGTIEQALIRAYNLGEMSGCVKFREALINKVYHIYQETIA